MFLRASQPIRRVYASSSLTLFTAGESPLPVAYSIARHRADGAQRDADRNDGPQQQGRQGSVVLAIEQILAAVKLVGHARWGLIAAFADQMINNRFGVVGHAPVGCRLPFIGGRCSWHNIASTTLP